MKSTPSFLPTFNKRGQHGVASIEFSLIALIMITMLIGMFVWWRTFQAHQSLTRATGDGARIAHSLISSGKQYPCVVKNFEDNQASIQNEVKQVILNSLKQSNMPGNIDTDFQFSPEKWSCSPGRFEFHTSYNIPPIFGGIGGLLEPEKISERGVINFNVLPTTP